MKVTQEQLETLTALIDELKSVRRVRTPDGAEHYGQPIGTAIVRDVPINDSTVAPFYKDIRDKFPLSRFGLGIHESDGKRWLEISMIEVEKEKRGQGIGRQVLSYITETADENNWILTLSPDQKVDGYDEDRLAKLYMEYGFVWNSKKNKLSGSNDQMVRYPKSNEKSVRRVRTPRGSQYYGQPIGTPIVRDTPFDSTALLSHPAITSLPPALGEAPLPDGFVRMYHQTPSANLPSIREEGLLWDRGRGFEGPKGVWISDKPFYESSPNLATIEIAIPAEDREQMGRIASIGDIPPEQFLTINEEWHDRVRQIVQEQRYMDALANGEYDDILEDESLADDPSVRAIRYIRDNVFESEPDVEYVGSGNTEMFAEEIEPSLEGMISPQAEASQQDWIYDNAWPEEYLQEVLENPEYQRALQDNLRRMGWGDEVTVVRRGDPEGRIANGSLDPDWQGRGYGQDESINEYRVPLESVIGVGHPNEAEVFFDMSKARIEEKADRRVRKPDYWGVPYGTPIVPGMKPAPRQLELPGMPSPTSIKPAENDAVRAERRESSVVGFAREQSDEIESLIRYININGFTGDAGKIERQLIYDYGLGGYENTYQSAYVSGGDWQMFGGARDIRKAAYDILGYDIEEEEENIADPHLMSEEDPGYGQGSYKAAAPYGVAYGILRQINEAEKVDIPLWRGVELYSYTNAKRFVEELKKDDTFDLPIASFAGRRRDSERFGDSVIFRVQKGAKAIQGGFMGYDEDDDKEYAYDSLEMSEIVTGGRFKVTNVNEDSQGRFIVSIRQIATFDPETGLATKMPNRRWKYAYLFDNSLRVDKNQPTTNAAEILRRTKSMLEDIFEGKARRPSVRHVRTPEGSRRYGQPIGAVIVADVEMTNFRELPSDWDGYDRYRGANGFNYWVYQENRRWYAVDDENYEIFNAASESELLQMIDEDARDPRAKDYRGVRTAPEGFHSASIDERNDLKVPPAWVDVFVNDDKNARLIAVGYDGKDRKQSLYSAEHTKDQADKKYKRMKTLHKFIPALDRALKEDWKTNENARVALLLRHMGMRIGSTSDTRAEQQAYGAATLEARHVRINKDSVTFTFTGKKGVQLSLNTKHPDILAMMRVQMQGKSRRDPVFPDATPTSVAAYIRDKTHPDVMVKDLRTYKANEIALAAISRIKRKPRTETEFKKMRNAVGDDVAAVLGNTRAMALGSYINPTVFQSISEDPAWLEKIVGKGNLPDLPKVTDDKEKDSGVKLSKVMAGLYETEDGRFQIESTARMDSPGPVNWILSEYVNGQYEYWNHFASLTDAKDAIARTYEFESAPRKKYRLPTLFWEDHYGRFAAEFDLPDLDRQSSSKYTSVELTKEQYENLLGDAEYYVEMAEDFDPEFRRSIVPSARAIIRALEKIGAPE